MKHIHNLIGGQLVPPVLGKYLPVENPATGVQYAWVPESSAEDLENALSAGEKAFGNWSRMPVASRSQVLLRLADLIDAHLEELAQAESRDTGKPVALARRMDIPRASANFRFFASAIINFSSEAHVNEDHSINYTHRAPLGIVGCISPWNLPLYLFTWKIAPALAMGNCVIGKPSELAPYTAFMLSKLAIEAGLPPGVLTILHGSGAGVGQELVAHRKAQAISFTGGTETGRKIGLVAADQFKKVSLELGGKNPVLIFEDCDFSKAVATTVRSSYTNQGEICLCGSRILVQKSIYQKFKEEFVKAVSQLKVGDPMKPETDLGALISENHLNKVAGFVDRARASGFRVLLGGERIPGAGYFYEPTVIEADDPNCEINQQEVFGPVATMGSFVDEEEAIAKANATSYGLASIIWTENLSRGHRVGQAMKSGIVWINCWLERDLRTPFGGMKSSGVGREGGNEALRFFSEPQNICIRT